MPADTGTNSNFDWLSALSGAGLGYAAAPRGLNLSEIGHAGRVGLQGLQNVIGGQTRPGFNQDILNTYQNPFLDRAIQAEQGNLTRQFTDTILPQISDAFSQAGSFGSGRQAALTGKATGALTQQLADIEAKQRSNAYNAAFDAAASSGQNQFTTQANAAQSLYGKAADIAQLDPLRQAVAGGVFGARNPQLGQVAGGIANQVGQGLRVVGGKIYDALGNLFNQETGQWIEQDGLNVWSGDQASGVGDVLGNIGSGIVDAGNNVLSGVQDFFGW